MIVVFFFGQNTRINERRHSLHIFKAGILRVILICAAKNRITAHLTLNHI